MQEVRKVSFRDVIKKSVLEGFTGNNITTASILVALGITIIIALYIFMVYYFATRKTFYNKSFNISLAIIAVITASIILAMQSNLVISLGMVGALSIIRFRTAVKDPKDLIFLFWSISVGIICGAGMYEIAIVSSLVVTIGLFTLELTPLGNATMLLVVNAQELDAEQDVMKITKQFCKLATVKSRNVSAAGVDFVVECKVKEQNALIKEITQIKGVKGASLIAHDGEVNF